jgi:hypothetical protein
MVVRGLQPALQCGQYGGQVGARDPVSYPSGGRWITSWMCAPSATRRTSASLAPGGRCGCSPPRCHAAARHPGTRATSTPTARPTTSSARRHRRSAILCRPGAGATRSLGVADSWSSGQFGLDIPGLKQVDESAAGSIAYARKLVPRGFDVRVATMLSSRSSQVRTPTVVSDPGRLIVRGNQGPVQSWRIRWTASSPVAEADQSRSHSPR